jgi:hypothetical protein
MATCSVSDFTWGNLIIWDLHQNQRQRKPGRATVIGECTDDRRARDTCIHNQEFAQKLQAAKTRAAATA